MSAFIVSTETMHRVVNAMCESYASVAQRDALGQKLFEMNHEAIIARYGDDDDFAEIPECYKSDHRDATIAESYKAVSCLLYQCSEGNVPERQLYRELDQLCDRLAHALASETPGYDRIPWDFPERVTA